MTETMWIVLAGVGVLSFMLILGILTAIAKAKETVKIEVNLFNFP